MMINSCLVSKSLNVTKHSTDIHTKKKKKLNCRNKLGCFHNIQTNMEALLICKCYQCALCKLTYATVGIFIAIFCLKEKEQNIERLLLIS